MSSALKRLTLGLSLLLPTLLPAQVFTGTISGIITDPNAAAVSGATLRAKNEATGETRTVTSNAEGLYTFSQLIPGSYEVSAEMQGFKRAVTKEVRLSVNQTVELNLSLQLGEVSQTVEVTAGVTMLDTQSANRAVTLDSQAVLDLPVNARNPFVHVHLNAGVIAVRTGISQATQDQNHNRFSMNGGRGQAGLTLIDGVPAAAVDWGGLIASPSVDSVQEVNIQRNQFDAQFGKSDGGAVNMITKGGSNEIHGAIFNFLRNDNLDGNSWANNRAGLKRVEFQRNQFGAAVGGPLWKSKKLYYFGTYEGLRQGSPNNFIGTVPTAAQRQGDFSNTRNADGSLSQLYNPMTTRANPAGAGFVRDPFPGNVIPSSMFNAVGRNVLALFPQANAPGDAFTLGRNFNAAGKTITTNDRVDGRIDWARNEKHTIFGRFTKAWQENQAPTFFGNGADTNFSDINPRHLVVIGNTLTPAPTWVINVLVGSGRWRENQISPSRGLDGTRVGLPASVVALFDTQTLPQFNMQNYSSISNPRWLNSARETHSLQANFTKELGKHSLKFGWLGELARLNNTDFNTPNFSFNRGLTSGPIAQVNANTTGDAIASLLLGVGSGGSVPTNPATATTARYDGLYVQDSWRVNRRLTVHLGLRWEVQYGRTERFNRLNTFNTTAANPLAQRVGLPLVGGLQFVDANNRAAWDTNYAGFAPRFGLAYKITDKLVFRGGYGVFYPQGGQTTNSGFSSSTAWVSTLGGDGLRPNPAAPITNPFPNGLTPPTGSSQGLATLAGESIGAMYRNVPNSSVQNISFDFQYEVAKGMVLEVGYSGSQGRKLLFGTGVNINQLPTQLLSLGSQLDQPVANPFFGVIQTGVLAGATVPRQRLLRPYPHFNAVNQAANIPGASSSFHALVVRYNWQISGNLNLLTTYQWSKAIDDASEWQGWEVGDTLRDAYNRRLDRSISAHDLPQSFVSALVYDLPVGKGKKYLASMPTLANAVLGGWQISSIVRLGSGLPLGFTANNTLSAYGFGVQRPNIANLKDLAIDNPTPDRWFNTAAAVQPGTYEIGNAPRWIPNVRFGPTQHWDLAILKNFRYGERIKAQFRAEMFNATNTPQFGRASTNINAADYGRVSGTTNVGPRNVQLGLRIQF